MKRGCFEVRLRSVLWNLTPIYIGFVAIWIDGRNFTYNHYFSFFFINRGMKTPDEKKLLTGGEVLHFLKIKRFLP
jgi:hypothetical protein